MPPLNLLIKPASGSCNMRCGYCFYADIGENRAIPAYGMMSLQSLEAVVKKALQTATHSCNFAFQGGEPTLIGLPFYRACIELVKKYNTKRLKISYAIQTNGYVIGVEWAKFFAEQNFLVGLSLDGVKDVHDLHRRDAQGNGTFAKTMHAAQLFDQYGVEYNILTVITEQLVQNIGKVYGFYTRNRFDYQQYIPCLDPIGEQRGQHSYSLTPQRYGVFLTRLFDLWYRDIRKGKTVSIRYFDNLVSMLRGTPPESCGMLGRCTLQNVVEADGEVYPCDFYALDAYRLGNLNSCDFVQINEQRTRIGFIEESLPVNEKCEACRWYGLCRGGCRRDRELLAGDALSLNYFCEAYELFFDNAYGRLEELARARL